MGAESWTSGVLAAAAMKDGLDRPDGLVRYFGAKHALLRKQNGNSCAPEALARGWHGWRPRIGSGAAGTSALQRSSNHSQPIPTELHGCRRRIRCTACVAAEL